jgi:restriction endonuclease S subunit
LNKRNENRPGYKETWAGWIPVDWESLSLGDLCTINYGDSPKDLLGNGGNIPIVGTSDNVRYGNQSNVDGKTIVIGRKGSIDQLLDIKISSPSGYITFCHTLNCLVMMNQQGCQV